MECVEEILGYSEREAMDCFIGLRWDDDSNPMRCRYCGSGDRYLRRLSTRPVIKCNKCGCHNGVTAGTIFHSTKMTLKQCLLACALYWDTCGIAKTSDYETVVGITNKSASVLRKRLDEVEGCPFDSKSRFVGLWRSVRDRNRRVLA
jgi:hypothetical protein